MKYVVRCCLIQYPPTAGSDAYRMSPSVWTEDLSDRIVGKRQSSTVHCKKSLVKFRCGQRWREPNDVGVGKFLLPRRLVVRHRCQHRSLAQSDMAFQLLQIKVVYQCDKAVCG